MIKKIVTLGLLMSSVAYSWAAEPTGKVFSDKDLKNYTSESDERARAYDYSIIQIERASKEVRAKREFREEVRRNVEKSKAELAEKTAEAEERNRKNEQKQRERAIEYVSSPPPPPPPPVIINVPPPPPVPGPAVIISPSGRVSTGIVIPY